LGTAGAGATAIAGAAAAGAADLAGSAAWADEINNVAKPTNRAEKFNLEILLL
jgi:hypothetical protein